MIRAASILMLMCCSVLGQQMLFTWTPATNRLANSTFTLRQGSVASGNYSKSWTSPTNGIVLDVANLSSGVNYFAVEQVSTNSKGLASETAASGEVQVIKNPAVSINVLTSTNLGVGWSIQSSVTFPTVEQQRFWKLEMIKSNQILYPPPTP